MYKRLIMALGIPVLIITDMDIKRGNEDEDNEIIQYPQISCLTSKETTNETIVKLYGKSDLSLIPEHIEIGNLYVAYLEKYVPFQKILRWKNKGFL